MCEFLDIDYCTFFFGENAIQNYVSEIFGITISVLIIDRLIIFREKKRQLPIKNIAYSLLCERNDDFLCDFVPIQFRKPTIGTVIFNEFRANVMFHPKDIDYYKINEEIRLNNNSDLKMLKSLHTSDPLYLSLIDGKNQEIQKLVTYEKNISEIITDYSQILDHYLIVQLSIASHNIKKHFLSFTKSVINASDYENTNLEYIIPELIKINIEVREFLIKKRTNK